MANSSKKRVYWDACAWIALIQDENVWVANENGEEQRGKMCAEVLRDAEKGNVEIVTSALSLAEICKSKAVRRQGYEQRIRDFFENSYIIVVNVDTYIGTEARELMQNGRTGLKPADAIHLASARVANVDEAHTFDDKLLGMSETINRRDGRGLRIKKPHSEKAKAPLLDHAADQIGADDADITDSESSNDNG